MRDGAETEEQTREGCWGEWARIGYDVNKSMMVEYTSTVQGAEGKGDKFSWVVEGGRGGM